MTRVTTSGQCRPRCVRRLPSAGRSFSLSSPETSRDSPPPVPAHLAPGASAVRWCVVFAVLLSRGCAWLIRAPLPSPPVIISVGGGRLLSAPVAGVGATASCGGEARAARAVCQTRGKCGARREANAARGGRGARHSSPHHAAPSRPEVTAEARGSVICWLLALGCPMMRLSPATTPPPRCRDNTKGHTAKLPDHMLVFCFVVMLASSCE